MTTLFFCYITIQNTGDCQVTRIAKLVTGTGNRPTNAGNPCLMAQATQVLLATFALLDILSQNPAARAPLLKAEFSINYPFTLYA